MAYTYEYARPMVCVDIIVYKIENTFPTHILLIERKNDPHKNCWALPGGFIEMEEDLVVSAYRELEEETNISGIQLEQLKTYGKPGRDPRGRTISVVFYGEASHKTEFKAGDDAADAQWVPLSELPDLAFDHKLIVDDFLKQINS